VYVKSLEDATVSEKAKSKLHIPPSAQLQVLPLSKCQHATAERFCHAERHQAEHRHVQDDSGHQGHELGSASGDTPCARPLGSGLGRPGGAGSPGKDLAVEVQTLVLEALAISDVVYGSFIKRLGSRAKDRSRVIIYICTMGEEQALSRLTSETLRSVGEIDDFLL